jgi:hypothetical protein
VRVDTFSPYIVNVIGDDSEQTLPIDHVLKNGSTQDWPTVCQCDISGLTVGDRGAQTHARVQVDHVATVSIATRPHMSPELAIN